MSAQAALAKTYISEDEYARGEELSETKHEWFNGEVFAMAGGSNSHAILCANISGELRNSLKGKACRALGGEQRVKIEATGLQTYPDAMVYCPPTRFEGNNDQVLLTPKVLVEVLSPSTQAYDLGDKFSHYAQIETLTDYILVAQESVLVRHYRRQENGDWLLRWLHRRDDALEIADLEIVLPLSEIYDGLDVPEGWPNLHPETAD